MPKLKKKKKKKRVPGSETYVRNMSPPRSKWSILESNLEVSSSGDEKLVMDVTETLTDDPTKLTPAQRPKRYYKVDSKGKIGRKKKVNSSDQTQGTLAACICNKHFALSFFVSVW